MKVCDQALLPDTTEAQDPGAGSNDDLEEADQLISDLAALLDAGHVVVHEHVLGPPRYGVGAEPGGPRDWFELPPAA
jgi:hypothetical protein